MSNDVSSDGTEQSFEDWLTEKLENAREVYKRGPRSENPRQEDIALGKIRAYRNARTEFLNRTQDTGTDQEETND